MGKDSMKAAGGKVCVNCRSPAKDLYKIYSSNVIKISECDNCKEISDKYVEFENVIVFIDLALLKTAAYRHVLFNTDFKKYLKYSIILICIEAYLLWNNVFTSTENLPHHADEKGFYISVLIVLLEHLVLFTVLYAFLRICAPSLVPVKLLWKALTVSHFFSELLLIPTMIWRESSMWELGLNYILIKGYSLLSMICSISVVSNISHFRTTLIILSAISIRHFSSSLFRPVINENLS